jgi:hypothetical protein
MYTLDTYIGQDHTCMYGSGQPYMQHMPDARLYPMNSHFADGPKIHMHWKDRTKVQAVQAATLITVVLDHSCQGC